MKAPWVIFRGVRKSLHVFTKESVALVVGFGSYHTFPLLLAARLRGIPFVLFEPNAYPGRVNRLFSKWAKFTGIQLVEGEVRLKGPSRPVSSLVRTMESVTREEAAAYFSLDPTKKTLLVFGGSQGALTINNYLYEIAPELKVYKGEWQIVHFVGKNDDVKKFAALYEREGIVACVKEFEEKMGCAWSLADLVISRSGASTIAEQLHFSTPALYIPYPFAADDHQTKNATVIERSGGGIVIKQGEGAALALLSALKLLMRNENPELRAMASALKAVKETQNQQDLSSLILQVVNNGNK